MKCKFISVIIICYILFSYTLNFYVMGNNRNINLEIAKSSAIENNSLYQSALTNFEQKQSELEETRKMINEKKKDKTVIISDILKNAMLKSDDMPKEIELLLKVSEIENSISTFEKMKNYEKVKSQINVEQIFYDILLCQYEEEYNTLYLEELNTYLSEIENQVLIGTSNKNNQEYIETSINTLKKEIELNIADLDSKKSDLSKEVGIDVKFGYTFEENIPDLSIDYKMLEQIIDYAVSNDLKLFEAVQKQKTAEKDIEMILGTYRNQYGNYINDVGVYVNDIENYIINHKGMEMDYEDFISENDFYNLSSPWQENYDVNFMFFHVKMPKEWFSKNYDTRYLEDNKYALFTAFVNKAKAEKEKMEVEETLIANINNSYNKLKLTEKAINETRENINKLELNYNKKLNEYKINSSDYFSVISAKEELNTQEKNLYELKIEYAKDLSSFNDVSCGYLNNLNMVDLNNELQEIKNNVSDEITWYMKPFENSFIFGVHVPEKYDVETFELFYNDVKVGDRTNIEKELISSVIQYENTTELKIKFFKGDLLVYEAVFEANSYGNKLNIVEFEKDNTVIDDIVLDDDINFPINMEELAGIEEEYNLLNVIENNNIEELSDDKRIEINKIQSIQNIIKEIDTTEIESKLSEGQFSFI